MFIYLLIHLSSLYIYSRKTKTNHWYAPMLELNDLSSVSVYFPDGTWCHNDGDTDYFCRSTVRSSVVCPSVRILSFRP